MTDDRDAVAVEGRLDFRLDEGPLCSRVSVSVIDHGRAREVLPDSIEVLEASGLTLGQLKAGWEVFDLDDARSKGLLTEPQERVGGTWAKMFARLHQLVTPLLNAGWEIYETDRDCSCGDDWAFYLLQRNDSRIDVELSDRGWIDVWDLTDDADEDDQGGDPTPPMFQSTLEDDTFVWECTWLGWLEPAADE
jgi:hypothetical protein